MMYILCCRDNRHLNTRLPGIMMQFAGKCAGAPVNSLSSFIWGKTYPFGFMNFSITNAVTPIRKQTARITTFWIFDMLTDWPDIPEPGNEPVKDGREELSAPWPSDEASLEESPPGVKPPISGMFSGSKTDISPEKKPPKPGKEKPSEEESSASSLFPFLLFYLSVLYIISLIVSVSH